MEDDNSINKYIHLFNLICDNTISNLHGIQVLDGTMFVRR